MTKLTRRERRAKGDLGDTNSGTTPAIDANVRRQFTAWTITAIAVPVALIIVGLFMTQYWYRPQLTMSVAKALVGSQRIVDSAGVHEYRTVVDLQTPCVAWLVEYSADTEFIMPPPAVPTRPGIVYGVYLQNDGRTEISDIRLTFRSRAGDFDVTGSPQLSLTQTQGTDPEGQAIHTVTIASLAPRSMGVIVGLLRVTGGSVSIDQRSAPRYRVNYSLGDADRAVGSNTHVRFSGARQLGDTPVLPMSVNALFARQKEAFGFDAVRLPIDPVEMSAEGGAASIGIIAAPFMSCPDAAPGGYSVPIRQRVSQSSQSVPRARPTM
jgi:hypothetical protein